MIVSKEKENLRSRTVELDDKVMELEDLRRDNEEYENKVVLISQEIERLNLIIKQRTKEKLELVQKVTDLETIVRKLEGQLM